MDGSSTGNSATRSRRLSMAVGVSRRQSTVEIRDATTTTIKMEFTNHTYYTIDSTSSHSATKKFIDKGSDEYKKRRERNNVAVRKSREKAKLRSRETERRVAELSKENQLYRAQYEELRREFNVLKSLLLKTGLTEQVIEDQARYAVPPEAQQRAAAQAAAAAAAAAAVSNSVVAAEAAHQRNHLAVANNEAQQQHQQQQHQRYAPAEPPQRFATTERYHAPTSTSSTNNNTSSSSSGGGSTTSNSVTSSYYSDHPHTTQYTTNTSTPLDQWTDGINYSDNNAFYV